MEELVGQVRDIRQSVDQSINGGRKQEMETLSHGDAETRVCSGEALIPVDDKTKELEVQVLWQPPFQCDQHCHCTCHKVHRGRSPQMLDNLLGVLFWTYSGLAITRQACDTSTYVRKSDYAVKISYLFPSWYVRKAISLTCKMMPLGGPLISLKTARIIDYCAPIFHLVRLGDIDAIKALYKQGLASSLDIAHKKLGTPLHAC